jgi:AmmeMemoRadiSam system protein B
MAELVRRSAIAGTWYPGSALSLRAEVGARLDAARIASPTGTLRALIAPHAGLQYSGPVAAFAYGLLRGREALTVVLVGPSHRFAFEGCAVFAQGSFETPLGLAPVDADLADALVAVTPEVRADARPHEREHSLEMQLPFLQHLVPRLRIVPVLMGTQSRAEVDALVRALTTALAGRDVLLIASSDLSHYLARPEASAKDAKVVGDVETFAPDRLMDRLERERNVACGGGPMVAVMKAARALGADRATVLRYADSGDVGERDTSRVVGYLAAALTSTAA